MRYIRILHRIIKQDSSTLACLNLDPSHNNGLTRKRQVNLFLLPLLRNQNHGMSRSCSSGEPIFFGSKSYSIFVKCHNPSHSRLNRKLSDCRIDVNSFLVASSNFHHQPNHRSHQQGSNRSLQFMRQIGDKCQRCSSVRFKSSAIWFLLWKAGPTRYDILQCRWNAQGFAAVRLKSPLEIAFTDSFNSEVDVLNVPNHTTS